MFLKETIHIMRPEIYLKRKEEKRILSGHPWIFSNEIHSIEGLYEDGQIVDVFDHGKKYVGTGYLNSKSLISVRMLSRENIDINRKFFEDRLIRAIDYRTEIMKKTDAFRLIFGESDFLPGLIADKYGPYIVIQILTLGMEKLEKEIIEAFNKVLSPKGILLRNDSPFRKLEGLEQEKKILSGNINPEEIIIEESGLKFKIDIWNGQKTGFFLDQRDNRDFFKTLNLSGKGLDCFCYTGSWGLSFANSNEITFVDSSEEAIRLGMYNSRLNGIENNTKFIHSDGFDFLRSSISRGTVFDWIVLDPPAFVKNKKHVRDAIAGYSDINLMAMKLLKRGGILITSSCSYNLREDVFFRLIKDSARKIKREIILITYKGQSRDHPVLLNMAESKYLKCAFLEVI